MSTFTTGANKAEHRVAALPFCSCFLVNEAHRVADEKVDVPQVQKDVITLCNRNDERRNWNEAF
jgi:hypothetical protein